MIYVNQRVYSLHALISCILDALASGGLTDRGGTAPPPVSWFLETARILPFIYKPTNPEPHLLYLAHTLPCQYSPVLITTGQGTRQFETASIPQSLLNLFKVANPKCVYPVLTTETTIKAHALLSPASWPNLTLTCVCLCGMVCPFLLGTVTN